VIFAIFGYGAVAHTSRVNCDEVTCDIDQDNHQTGTAIGCRASCEH